MTKNIVPADPSDRTGYKSPPKKHQFKKGQSGNPNGRPKGSGNFATMFKQVMEEKVVVRDATGKARSITKFRAAITQVMNKAASGNLSAFKLALGIMNFVEADAGVTAPLLGDLDSGTLLAEFLRDYGTAEPKAPPKKRTTTNTAPSRSRP